MNTNYRMSKLAKLAEKTCRYLEGGGDETVDLLALATDLRFLMDELYEDGTIGDEEYQDYRFYYKLVMDRYNAIIIIDQVNRG